MPLVRNKLIATVKWRDLGRRVTAEDETKECLERGTQSCWATGSVLLQSSSSGVDSAVAGVPPRVAPSSPTLREFISLDQMDRTTFGPLRQKYGGPQYICGAMATASALVLCDGLSRRGLWNGGLDSASVAALLGDLCEPRRVVPLVENVLHFSATLRVNYLRAHDCPGALASSPSQQKRFMAEWAANFELSDCVRSALSAAAPVGAAAAAATATAAAAASRCGGDGDEDASVFGPAPHPFVTADLARDLSSSLSRLLLLRANLFPIASQSKFLQRQRILMEDAMFGGVEKSPGVLSYQPGEAAFFVDMLASDVQQGEGRGGAQFSKFVSPRRFCTDVLPRDAPTLQSCRGGCRVYIVDVVGHFVALLCFVDPTGTPHGIVVNSSEGNWPSLHAPTVRVAFDMYVANVAAAFVVPPPPGPPQPSSSSRGDDAATRWLCEPDAVPTAVDASVSTAGAIALSLDGAPGKSACGSGGASDPIQVE